MSEPPKSVARYCANWIESYLEYTSQYNSPEIFRRWTAVSIIAAALERKVWVVTAGRQLFPNQYILLTGPPGVGKTEAVRSVHDFLAEVSDVKLSAMDVSSATLYDEMLAAERKVIRPTEVPPIFSFNAMTVAVMEFGIFLKQYDNTFMSKLNDMFDGMPIKESKRGNKLLLNIPSPLLNLISGTTPGWMGANLPAAAWQEGFTSRLIIIYSGEQMLIDLFGSRPDDTALAEKLVQDLRMIHNLFGQMQWMENVQATFTNWYRAGMPPRPEHPKLEHYTTRRTVHMIKLMMANSVARSNEMIIRMEDYQAAQEMLLEAEMYMPDIFKSMSMSTDSGAYEEAFAFTYQIWLKENKPVKQHRIINFIRERVPTHSVMKVLETMVHSRMLKVGAFEADGNHGYIPIPRAEHGR